MDATLGSTNPLRCFPLANPGGTAINHMSHRSIGHLRVMCHHKEHNSDDSTMNGDDGKKARGALKAGMVLACMLGAMCVSRPMCTLALEWPGKKHGHVQTYESMKSEVDKLVSEDAKPQHLLEKFRLELKKDVRARDYKKLEAAARKLRKRREFVKKLDKEFKAEMNKAVEMLVQEYNKAKDIDKDHAYHLGRLLVELLIYQGHYSKAKEECSKLMNVMPTDGRPLLLQAVTNLMLSDLEGAETCLEAYKDIDMSKPPF